MEKIAILTYCVSNNFGANLQALSTAHYLLNHGFEPVFLRWVTSTGGNTPDNQREIHQSFLKEKGFIVSEPLESDSDFLNYLLSNNIRKIIVGSDCVLTFESKSFPYRFTRKGFIKINRPKSYTFPNPFWLPFLTNEKNFKCCLMSASTGGKESVNINDNSLREKMANLMNRFDFISVRDSFTKRLLNGILPNRRDIQITPDPVFGFNNNVHNIPTEEEIRKKYKIDGKYYVVCFYRYNWPDQKWADSLMAEAHKNGVICISVPMPQGGRNSNFDLDIELPLDPIDWYSIIKYSNGYIGNNMHPIIVAMHNNVPFFSYNIHGRSFLHGRIQLIKTSKEYDLLSRFGLQRFLVPQPFIRFISPKKVINRINSFELDKCREASIHMQREYEEMMKTIMNTLCS